MTTDVEGGFSPVEAILVRVISAVFMQVQTPIVA